MRPRLPDSDATLGFDGVQTCEARSVPFNKLMHDLVHTLSSSNFRNVASAIADKGLLASGMLLQQPFVRTAIPDIIEFRITSREPANVTN